MAPFFRRYGTARKRPRPIPGEMNKTEKEYAELLEARKLAGEIDQYMFDSVTFRLAKNTTYRPDFFVVTADGTVEFHEVKGHWEDDARAKIKIAAYNYPFRFVAVTKNTKKNGGGWKYEEFSNIEPEVIR